MNNILVPWIILVGNVIVYVKTRISVISVRIGCWNEKNVGEYVFRYDVAKCSTFIPSHHTITWPTTDI